MEAIKEIYKCPLCSHGTLDPENHSCHRQFVIGKKHIKDIPLLQEWEEHKEDKKSKAEKTHCKQCGKVKDNGNIFFCSRRCFGLSIRKDPVD